MQPGMGDGGRDKTIWRYQLSPQFDRATLLAMTGKKPYSPSSTLL
jgi:hypothetical protein